MICPTLLEQPTLITGASSGIGFACANKLALLGAKHLIITGRDINKLEQAKSNIQRQSDALVEIFVCDQSQPADVNDLLSYLEENKKLGGFVANVGINDFHEYGARKIHNLTQNQITQSLTTNVTHLMFLLTQILGGMHHQRFGRIVLMGSQGWIHSLAGQALYNLYKSSLVGLTNSIVSEYASQNIFCHLLNPGVVLNKRTEKLRKKNQHLAEKMGITESAVADKVIELLSIDDKQLNGQISEI